MECSGMVADCIYHTEWHNGRKGLQKKSAASGNRKNAASNLAAGDSLRGLLVRSSSDE